VKPLVLLVEDESAVRKILGYNLRAAGFAVEEAADGEEGLERIRERLPDVVLLDWMLPKLSGIELCRILRRNRQTAALPILMITARGEEADRLRGLDVGADDYVVKPFSPAEVVARIRAVLRRARPEAVAERLCCGDIRIDLSTRRAFRGERPLALSPTEFRLLRFLMEHPGRVFDRTTLLDRVWGAEAEVEPRAVDAAVKRLRRALNAAGDPDPIRTVRGEGYAFEPREMIPGKGSAQEQRRGEQQGALEPGEVGSGSGCGPAA